MSSQVVVGIDVGGESKGFHAVALCDDRFVDRTTNSDPLAITKWCIGLGARVVAVDAPCRWSASGKSRLAERQLGQKGITCFSTPTRDSAKDRAFYAWVFNGERLYQSLADHYCVYDGERIEMPICIETFPHAIVCALAGKVVAAKPKVKIRREALHDLGYHGFSLPNIDFVDAALCAVTADRFSQDSFELYGNPEEGFIVVPSTPPANEAPAAGSSALGPTEAEPPAGGPSVGTAGSSSGNAALLREARVFGRYLMGEAPSDELAARYAEACRTLLGRSKGSAGSQGAANGGTAAAAPHVERDQMSAHAGDKAIAPMSAGTPPRQSRDRAIVRMAVERPWTLGCLEAACALGRPDALLRRKLLIMAAILEAAPDRAEWFVKDRTGAAEAAWTLAVAGLRSGAKVFIGGIILAFVRGGRG